jgi:hypothetical protein
MTIPPRDLPIKVAVTDHARERARERFPGFKSARIVDDVRSALRAGRVSTSKPPGYGGSAGRSCLYVWTETGDRAYPLLAEHDALLVLTTLVRGG